ncbi:MAG TPA: DUF4870 domain-containing protein [Ktedonobacteraceae bacterium]|nr:DUF4870 domain-containing protein [Ktedonobacteraceae bacterium]
MKEIIKQSQVQYDEEQRDEQQQPASCCEDCSSADYQQAEDASRPFASSPSASQGAPQQRFPYSAPGDVSVTEMTSMGLRARTAGMLCYLFGWVGGLIFLLLERDNRFVRFHAAQSILFFGAVNVLAWVCSFFPFAFFGLGIAVGLAGFIGWVVLMIAAYRGQYYRLPFLSKYAEQLANQIGR